MPITLTPTTNGSSAPSPPSATAQITRPAENNRMPAVMTRAGPNRLINLPANNNEVNGTNNGPGAMESPVFSADQPQTVCSHSAAESSMAPNATEYGAITSQAP